MNKTVLVLAIIATLTVTGVIIYYKPIPDFVGINVSLSAYCDTDQQAITGIKITIDDSTTELELPYGSTFEFGTIHVIHIKTLLDSSTHPFKGWNSETGGNVDLQVSETGSYVAHFASIIPPSKILTIESATNGVYNITVGQHSYVTNTIVYVRAIPNAGYLINYWLLDGATVSTSQIITSVTMSIDHTLQAVFMDTTPPTGLLLGLRCAYYDPPFSSKTPQYFVTTANTLASKFSGSTPAMVWVVGGIQGSNNEICWLNFPHSGSVTGVQFSSTDQNEAFLDASDAAGMKVWLQVEPADADMNTLIDLVMNQYKSHSCVIGFGIDAEWYHARTVTDGAQITSANAQSWLNHLTTTFGSKYKMFLKHWTWTNHLPSYQNANLVYISDSSAHGSLNNMISDFSNWANYYSSSEVGYQICYQNDKTWWNTYADPFKTISTAILNAIPSCKEIYWTCETILSKYP